MKTPVVYLTSGEVHAEQTFEPVRVVEALVFAPDGFEEKDRAGEKRAANLASSAILDREGRDYVFQYKSCKLAVLRPEDVPGRHPDKEAEGWRVFILG